MFFNCKLCYKEWCYSTYICHKCDIIQTYFALYGRDETLATIEKVLKMRLEKDKKIKDNKDKVIEHIKLKDRVK